MNYPTVLYADTDLVCGVEPKEGHQKYVRADAKMFCDRPTEEAYEELTRLRWQINRLEWWMQEVTASLCHQPSVPLSHKRGMVKALEDFTAATSKKDSSVADAAVTLRCCEKLLMQISNSDLPQMRSRAAVLADSCRDVARRLEKEMGLLNTQVNEAGPLTPSTPQQS